MVCFGVCIPWSGLVSLGCREWTVLQGVCWSLGVGVTSPWSGLVSPGCGEREVLQGVVMAF